MSKLSKSTNPKAHNPMHLSRGEQWGYADSLARSSGNPLVRRQSFDKLNPSPRGRRGPAKNRDKPVSVRDDAIWRLSQHESLPDSRIAEALGIHPSTVGRIMADMRSRDYKAEPYAVLPFHNSEVPLTPAEIGRLLRDYADESCLTAEEREPALEWLEDQKTGE